MEALHRLTVAEAARELAKRRTLIKLANPTPGPVTVPASAPAPSATPPVADGGWLESTMKPVKDWWNTTAPKTPNAGPLTNLGERWAGMSPAVQRALMFTGGGAALGGASHFLGPNRKRRSLLQSLATGGLAGAGVAGGYELASRGLKGFGTAGPGPTPAQLAEMQADREALNKAHRKTLPSETARVVGDVGEAVWNDGLRPNPMTSSIGAGLAGKALLDRKNTIDASQSKDPTHLRQGLLSLSQEGKYKENPQAKALIDRWLGNEAELNAAAAGQARPQSTAQASPYDVGRSARASSSALEKELIEAAKRQGVAESFPLSKAQIEAGATHQLRPSRSYQLGEAFPNLVGKPLDLISSKKRTPYKLANRPGGKGRLGIALGLLGMGGAVERTGWEGLGRALGWPQEAYEQMNAEKLKKWKDLQEAWLAARGTPVEDAAAAQ